MELGMIGLGRMGGNMTRRLIGGGHNVAVFDVSPEAVSELGEAGATPTLSLQDLVSKLPPPRAVWLMIPAGEITERTIAELGDLLTRGDVIVDGGNSHYRDSFEVARSLAEKGIALIDVGVSGGIWGLEEGFCLMVGGDGKAIERLKPVFETLAPADGFAHVGPSGSGHFVKMVHNGIEYALMQSYAEGFELLSSSDFDLDLAQISELWRHGSVVRSWLLDLAARALSKDPNLSELSDYIEDSGEGRWTVQAAIDSAVPTPMIALALFHRFASRQDSSFAGRLIAALRREFGGHAVHPENEA